MNRASDSSFSEVTGITQTARNFGASLGLAVLGAILISRNTTNVTAALIREGVPRAAARKVAASFGSAAPRSGTGSGRSPALVRAVQGAFAHSTQTVFYAMAIVLAVTFVVALIWLPGGQVQAPAGSSPPAR